MISKKRTGALPYDGGSAPGYLGFASPGGAANSIVTYDGEEGQYISLLFNQSSLIATLTPSATSLATSDALTRTAALFVGCDGGCRQICR